MKLGWIVCLVMGSSVAAADPPPCAAGASVDPLPRGLRIAQCADRVVVVRGGTRAVLPIDVTALEAAHLAADEVTITGSDVCANRSEARMSLAELEARIADAEATEHLRHRRFREAIARAEHAIALAPGIDELTIQLAAIRVAAGQPREAARTLAPLAARNPVWLYLQLQDRGLAALTRTPELAALHARHPAHVDLARQAALVNGRFLAVATTERGDTSMNTETRVQILELATGRTVLTIPRVAWSYELQPTDLKAVAARTRQVERWLADLGFAAVPGESGTFEREASGKNSTTFAKAGLTVTSAGKILRGTKVVGARPELDGPATVDWLPDQRLMMFFWQRRQSEGCDTRVSSGIAIVKVP